MYFSLFNSLGLFFSCFLFFEIHASSLQIGQPTYGGSGCPQGTARVISSPNGTSLSILFDQFMANAGGGSQKRQDLKNCLLQIPVSIPAGYSATISKVDYRGYISVPKGGNTKIQVSYMYSRRRGLIYTKVFPGVFTDSFLFLNDLDARSMVWSGCGEQTELKIDADLEIRTNNQNEEAVVTIDSADASAGLKYYFQLKRC